MKIFVCEFITGGGFAGKHLPARLAAEGDMMLEAVLRDLLATGEVELFITRDERLKPFALPLTAIPMTVDMAIWERWRECMRGMDAVLPIAPETDRQLERLTQLAQEQGVSVIGSAPRAIAIAARKSVSSDTLSRAGVPTAGYTRLDSEPPDSDHGWVVKPDDGVGCEGIHYFRDSAALNKWRREQAPDSAGIIQPFLPGVPASLSLLCRAGEVRVLACNRQYIHPARGQFHLNRIGVNEFSSHATSMAPLAERIASAMPELWGYVGVDLILTPNGAVVLEVNPRLTIAYVGLHDSIGVNPAALLLALRHGRDWPFHVPLKRERVAIDLVSLALST